MTNNSLIVAALASAFKRPDVDFEPGKHNIDVTVRVKGQLTISKAGVTKPSPDWKAIALASLARLDDDGVNEVQNQVYGLAAEVSTRIRGMELALEERFKAYVEKNLDTKPRKGSAAFKATEINLKPHAGNGEVL